MIKPGQEEEIDLNGGPNGADATIEPGQEEEIEPPYRASTLSFLQMVSGVVLITFAAVMEQPPSSGIAVYVLPDLCAPLPHHAHLYLPPPPHRACVIVGSVMLGVFTFVCFAHRLWVRRDFLIVYLFFSILLTILQFTFSLILFVNPDMILDSLNTDKYVSSSDTMVVVAKYMLLVLACIQLLYSACALVVMCRILPYKTRRQARSRNLA